MKIVTRDEMRFLDLCTIEEIGIPGMVLMENAGREVVRAVEAELGDVAGKKIWIFAGAGNNGGDGFVVARHLANRGARIKIVLLADPRKLQGDAATNYNIARKLSLDIITVQTPKDLMAVKIGLPAGDLVVDAIFGTGLDNKVEGEAAEIIALINGSDMPVIAVDLPSGLDSDTGHQLGICVNADQTVTFGFPKIGICLNYNSSPVGKLTVADIGIPNHLTSSMNLSNNLVLREDVMPLFPRRQRGGHKGTYGHLLVVAGSVGMTGAAVLSSMAAMKSGAGLTTLGAVKSIQGIMELKMTEVMTVGLPEQDDGAMRDEAAGVILGMQGKFNAAAIGCGLGSGKNIRHILEQLLPDLKIPVVLDADALNVLSEDTEILKSANVPVILTPHPGEMGRLCHMTAEQVQKKRPDVARSFAMEYGVVVVLKGNNTIIASPDGNLYINTSGNPGMATGGSGDILTGVIGSLLAQGMDPLDAAVGGVYIHGMAGDLASGHLGEEGLISGDILEYLPVAIKSIRG